MEKMGIIFDSVQFLQNDAAAWSWSYMLLKTVV